MSTAVDRVRQVIADIGMSQSDFAEAIGLDAPKMSKSLSGTRRFSSLEYARIAQLGSVSVDWLLTGVEPAFATAARRLAGSDGHTAVAEARRLVELRTVAGELGYPQPPIPALNVNLGRSARADGESLALAALGLTHERGRHETAADLANLIENDFGVDVCITDLGDDFDGLSAIALEARAILVSPTGLFARQRFTLAHELGHILAQDDQGIHLDKDINSATNRKNSVEVRANAFAAAYLMPAQLLRERVVPGFNQPAFCELVLDLKVSPSALAYRLTNLRLIDSMTAESFKTITYASAAHNAHRTAEVAEASARSSVARLPAALARDLFDAYTKGKTTLRPYATLLGVDPVGLRAGFEADVEVM